MFRLLFSALLFSPLHQDSHPNLNVSTYYTLMSHQPSPDPRAASLWLNMICFTVRAAWMCVSFHRVGVSDDLVQFAVPHNTTEKERLVVCSLD